MEIPEQHQRRPSVIEKLTAELPLTERREALVRLRDFMEEMSYVLTVQKSEEKISQHKKFASIHLHTSEKIFIRYGKHENFLQICATLGINADGKIIRTEWWEHDSIEKSSPAPVSQWYSHIHKLVQSIERDMIKERYDALPETQKSLLGKIWDILRQKKKDE